MLMDKDDDDDIVKIFPIFKIGIRIFVQIVLEYLLY